MRRAQAAMEFLMTYGWTILIMLVVIAVLFYSGVFSAQVAVPSSCVLPAGFTCSEFRLDGNGNLYLDVGQATGKQVTVTGIGCSTSANPVLTDFPNVQIRNGGHAVITGAGVPCLNSSGTAFKGKIIIQYTTAGSGLTRNVTGTLSAPMAGTATGTGYPTDLVLLLHLDNNTALGENSTKAVDSSGYGNNATLDCGIANGKIGLAIAPVGGTGATVPQTVPLTLTDNFSVTMWVNQMTNVSATPFDTLFWTGANYQGIGIGLRNTRSSRANPISVFIGNATTHTELVSSADTWAPGAWVHIAFVLDGGNASIYSNGVLAGSALVPRPVYYHYSNIYIGKATAGDGQFNPFNGTIDEVRVYSRALSAPEILALYQAGG